MTIKELIVEIDNIYKSYGVSLLKNFNSPLPDNSLSELVKKIEKTVNKKIPGEIIELYKMGNGDNSSCPSIFHSEWLPIDSLSEEYQKSHAWITNIDYSFGLKVQKQSFYERKTDDYVEDDYEDIPDLRYLLPIGYHCDPGWLFVDLSDENYGRLLVSEVDCFAIFEAPSLFAYLDDIVSKAKTGVYKYDEELGMFDFPSSWYEKTRNSD